MASPRSAEIVSAVTGHKSTDIFAADTSQLGAMHLLRKPDASFSRAVRFVALAHLTTSALPACNEPAVDVYPPPSRLLDEPRPSSRRNRRVPSRALPSAAPRESCPPLLFPPEPRSRPHEILMQPAVVLENPRHTGQEKRQLPPLAPSGAEPFDGGCLVQRDVQVDGWKHMI
ncbi:hypothetical protein FALBO_15300 [Fusarium albosuccineum]|uniref:Uncharacterized protein n=1 Tax=Fusarium albosuccineum TaxID=1237068 RepID=A0A8H4P5J9_9HYPO|nr:hypothetical protein FALBO_15300 [Fusarium albosuccineum]